MSYVYIQTEKESFEEGVWYRSLWTVGFYRPDGKFEPESDHGSAKEAAERVHWLNGGEIAKLKQKLETLEQKLDFHGLL